MIKDISLFLASSTLDIIIVSQDVTLDSGAAAILCAPRRKLLFHDETIKTFIVLACSNEYFKDQPIKWMSYLSCTIDGWIGDIQRYTFQVLHEEMSKERNNDGFNFFFRVINNKKMISEVVNEKIVIIWETTMLIPFPRIRTSAPKVQLIASVTVKPESFTMFQDEDQIFNSDISSNVLESLSSETMIYGITPFLSMSRISKDSIISDVKSLLSIETLRKVVKRVFTCGSAISLRTRSSMAMVPNFQKILLCIDIESCSANQLPVSIENIEIKVKGQVAHRIEDETQFPITLAFQEQYLILYYIPFDPSIDQGITDLLTLPVTIFVKMRPQLLNMEYSLLLMSQWHTTIHISKDQTQVSLYQSVIHTEAKVPDSNLHSQNSLIHANNYHLLKSKSPQLSDTKSSFWNISLTFTAPKCVKIWKVFEVEIVLVNQSNVSKDILLSLLSKIHDINYQIIPSTFTKEPDFLLEKNAIHTLHKHISIDPIHILPLTNSIRIRPLDSYGCYCCSLSFIAIREGLFSFEGIRVADMDTGAYIDCCSLPKIFVYS